jgi:hypothetical protein
MMQAAFGAHTEWGFLLLLEATTNYDQSAAERAFNAMMEMKKIDIATIEVAGRDPGHA